ncbi:hypothetical protein U9M48_023337 [Paspalum notatum var. saurae]|uniref:Reverse transcriptase Ty1/copia-type domain-containing protein n=1 Tax=Paspalum notatum var. saurae TaxID=547442 RepID=A0AAQ3WVQ3_PASNO
MKAELEAIHENDTSTFFDLLKGHRAIGLKWVFKVKRDPAGNILKHKARNDYDEVFAPIARMESLKVLVALASQGGWELHHMDVKSAFLNGNLSKQVFVHQPSGFVDEKHEG